MNEADGFIQNHEYFYSGEGSAKEWNVVSSYKSSFRVSRKVIWNFFLDPLLWWPYWAEIKHKFFEHLEVFKEIKLQEIVSSVWSF